MKLTSDELAAGALTPERLTAAVRTFRDTGIVTFENAFDVPFIESVRAAYEAELVEFLAAKGGLAGMEGKTFGRNHIGFFPEWRAPLADAQIVAHSIAVQVMAALLGKNLVCSFYNTNTAFPDSGTQPIHRDTQPLFGTEFNAPTPPTHIVLNIPLCDFSLANGSTEYWPGTHLIVDAAPEENRNLEARAQAYPSVRLNMPMGSFALRDLRAWHRGMPNLADYPRTMLAIVYQREWVAADTVTIPQSTWDAWPETARRIFRNNPVVSDAEYKPRTW